VPGLVQLHEKYAERGLVILGITQRDSLKAVEARSESEGWNLNYRVIYDKGGDIHSTYTISSTPTNYLIDPDGNVVGNGVPGTAQIEELLASARVYALPEDLPRSLSSAAKEFMDRDYGSARKKAEKVVERENEDSAKAKELVELVDLVGEQLLDGARDAVEKEDYVKAVKRLNMVQAQFRGADQASTAKDLEKQFSEEHEGAWKAATIWLTLEERLARAGNKRAKKKLAPHYRALGELAAGTPMARRALAKATELENLR
jgi:hypothetical protein